MEFVVLETDSCVYTRDKIIIKVYVDDIQIAGPDEASCRELYLELSRHFKVSSKVSSVLTLCAIGNQRDRDVISINQPGLIDRMLARFNMVNV
jgi:Reverse transcriptase (RNA-dependent DNA polymerase)